MRKSCLRTMLVGAAIALAGCGSKGDQGVAGKDGTNGAPGATGAVGATGSTGATGNAGTNGVNGVTGGTLKLVIDSVATAADLSKSTLTFTVYPAANVCPGGVCDDGLSSAVIGTKTFYAQEYNTTTKTFDTAKNFSYSGIHFKGFTADGNGAQYTATKTSPTWAPENSTSAYVYAYVTGLAAAPAPTSGHYLLPSSVASAAKVFGTIDYASNAVASGCERCHGAPYAKHGYRMAAVQGLPDFVACKACHTDQRPGSDAGWYVVGDDPAHWTGTLTDAQKTKYPYVANIMNDTHNSHGFEFNYPQSMANCTTCHAGKLDNILTDANFKPTVCKSCHAVTGPTAAGPTTAGLTGGVEGGRAPSLKAIFNAKNVASFHTMDLYAATKADGSDLDPAMCNGCHKTGGSGKTFKQIHSGMDAQIYAADGSKFSTAIKVTLGTTAFNATTNVLTVPFTVDGLATGALVKNTVVVGLYGWNTKDFVASGHSSGPGPDAGTTDTLRSLEYTDGSTSNSPRLTVAAGATAGSYTATADLSSWASWITSKKVSRVQVSVIPGIGRDQTKVIDEAKYLCGGVACSDTTSGAITANDNWNTAIAVTGATAQVKLSDGSIDATGYGLDIVDAKNCNACHDALATTFHNPNYGSATVTTCRICHWVGAGGSHLEMQSRSIDSYVHAIHRMQAFDISSINFADAVQKLRYDDKIEGNYPNFAGPLNCESCHKAGKYNPPDQTRSLGSIISASKGSALTGMTRNVGTFPAQITGPGERACGGCHRAELINEDDASGLASFYAHTTVNGTSALPGDAATLTKVQDQLMGIVGVTAPVATANQVAGVQAETCSVCHKTAGDQHQALFNSWRKNAAGK